MTTETTLRFLSINDVYDVLPNEQGIGGLAELATLVNRERHEIQEKYPDEFLLTTINGDFLSAAGTHNVYQGSHMIDIVNNIGFDWAVIGNHEFDFGNKVFRERINESKFKWIGGANVQELDGTPFANAVDTEVITCPKTGIRIGLFGICTPETPHLSYPDEDVVFTDILPATQKCVDILKKDGADVIIGLTHLSIAHDKLLAKKVPGIHLILGGHDHQPFTIYQGETFIHKSGQNANWLARIDLLIEKKASGRVTVCPQWSMIANRKICPEPSIKALIDKYLDALKDEDAVREATRFLAVTTRMLDTRSSSTRASKSNFANMIADIMREHVKADFGMINGGFVRGDKIYEPKDSLTVGDLRSEMPFSKPIVRLQLHGSELKEGLEQHLSKYPALSGSHPHVSGLKIQCRHVDGGATEIVSMLTEKDEPVDMDQKYTIALTTFVAAGGDGCTAWKKGMVLDTGEAVADAAIEFLGRIRTIDYDPEEERLTIIETTRD